jgi:ankyrin repeat protein
MSSYDHKTQNGIRFEYANKMGWDVKILHFLNNDICTDRMAQALKYALSYGNMKLIRILIAKGAPIVDGERLLRSSLRYGDTDLAQILINKGIQLHELWQLPDVILTTPMLQFLIKNGIEPKTIVQSLIYRREEVYKLILFLKYFDEINVKPASLKEYLQFVLDLAVDENDVESIKYILNKDAKLNIYQLVLNLVRNGKIRTLRHLLDYKSVKQVLLDRNTLILALEAKQIESVKFLIEQGADYNILADDEKEEFGV